MNKELKVGDRIGLAPVGPFSYEVYGTITEVHSVPGYPHMSEYSVEWDDGEYAGEIWDVDDFESTPEGEVKTYNA